MSNDSRRTGINSHDLIIGPSGAGKTRGYVLPNIYQAESSLIVTDTKGDLYDQTLQSLLARGYRVQRVNFRDCKGSPTGYNPFDYIRMAQGSPNEQDVLSIAAAFCPIEDWQQPFWEYAARGLIASMIYFVMAYLPKHEASTGSLTKLFDTVVDGRYERLLDDIRDEEPDSFAIRQYKFVEACKDAEKMKGSIYGIVGEKLGIFDYDGMRHLLSQRERVNFASLRREKTALIVDVSDCDRSQDRLIALFYQQAFKTLIDGGASGLPVRVILDDFAAGCRIGDFDNLISVLRSRNIHVSVIVQSIAQLEAMYRGRASIIVDNFDTTLYLGGNDPVTAKYIAERANMLPHAVLSMDLEDALLLQRGRPPRKVKRFKLEDHPEIADHVSREDGEEESLVDILDSFELGDDGIPF